MESIWHALGTITVSLRTLLIVVIAIVALVLWLGYRLWHYEPLPSTETFKPGHVQSDGSVVPTRIPSPSPGPAPHQIPKGAKEERRVHVVVKPKPHAPGGKHAPEADSHIPAADNMACSCEPLVLDMSVIRGPDGSGVVVSAENGDIIAEETVDQPIADFSAPQYRHFVHVTNEPGKDNYTATVGKRFLANRVGVGLGGIKREGDDAGPLVEIEFNW